MFRKSYPYLFALAAVLVAQTASAASFSLSSGTFKQGCPVSSSISMNTAGVASDAGNIIVHYDPTELTILDANAGQAGTQIATGNAYSTYADNSVDAAGGVIRLTGFSIGSSFTGAGLFGSIPFSSKPGVTSSSMTVEYVPGSTTDSNIADAATSNDLLSSVSNATLSFVSGPCTADTAPPSVHNPSPANGATNAPLNSSLSFHITDNQSGVDLSSVRVDVLGTSYTQAGPLTFTSSGTPLDYTITVNPTADFPANTEVVVRVFAKDIDNNVMPTFQWSFNRPPAPPVVPPTCQQLGCFDAAPSCNQAQISCPAPSICGDGICDSSETIETCRFDCVAAPVGSIQSGSVSIFALDGNLQLPLVNDVVELYPNESYTVRFTNTGAEIPARVSLIASTGEYAMLSKDGGHTYETKVISSSALGAHFESIREEMKDGTLASYRYALDLVAPFMIKDEAGSPIAGASYSLYRMTSNGRTLVIQSVTDAHGETRLIYAPGVYQIEADSAGFTHGLSDPLTTNSGVITGSLILKKPFASSFQDTVNSSQPLEQKITDVVSLTTNAVSDAIIAPLRRAQLDPVLQQTAADSITPLVIGTVAVLGVGAISYGFLPLVLLFALIYIYEHTVRKTYRERPTAAWVRTKIAIAVQFLAVPLFIATLVVSMFHPTPIVVVLLSVQVIGFAVFTILRRLHTPHAPTAA